MPFFFALSLYSLQNAYADPKPLRSECPTEEATTTPVVNQRSGAQAYREVCSMCHGIDAKGMEGIFPPLLPSERVMDENVLANVVLRGVVGEIYVSGKRYASAMPSFHEKLSDPEVVGIVEYLQHLNGKKSTITEQQVQKIREENVPKGSISSQAGLESLLKVKPKRSTSSSKSFWKGCQSD